MKYHPQALMEAEEIKFALFSQREKFLERRTRDILKDEFFGMSDEKTQEFLDKLPKLLRLRSSNGKKKRDI